MIKGSLREANAVMKRNTGKQDSVVLTTCTTGKHDSVVLTDCLYYWQA